VQATNDLDLTTIESVEALLSEYKGVLVVVSHDRQFVERTAERMFVLRGDGLVRLFDGSYSEVSWQQLSPDGRLAAVFPAKPAVVSPC
jgi:ABC transport system ATP-binding/permease protein